MGRVQDFNDWFCIPAFFVLFRETLEAAVLVAVLLQYLERAKRPELKRQVWVGAALGGLVSLALGAVILSVYYTQEGSLNTTAAFVVEGGMLAFAAVVISYFLVTHLAPGMKSKGTWETKWERNLDEMVVAELEGSKRNAFFVLSFTTVVREGFEAAIFVVGFGAAVPASSLPVAALAGVLVGVACGVAMMRGSAELDLSSFFKVSAGFLALIAAGLAAHASYEFQKGEAFGNWACERSCDEAPFGALASYQYASNVDAHARLDGDVDAMKAAAAAFDFEAAFAWYAEGGSSPKGDGYRTVRGFSKALHGEPTYDEFFAYTGSETYADDFVSEALRARLPAGAVGDATTSFSGDDLTDTMAYQLAVKGAQYQHTWIYATHELYAALAKCEDGDVEDLSGAPHNWDEAWAFYVGSLAGEDGADGGVLSYALADKRCGNFGTCQAAPWRSPGDGASSDVNARLLALYRAGLVALRAGDCGALGATYIPAIVSQMTVPLIQGALRYAYYSDPAVSSAALDGDGAAVAELRAFAAAALPRIHACDADAAAVIARNSALPDGPLDGASAGALVPDGHRAVKAAFEASYACLGLSCADVGGWEGVEGMGPCVDGGGEDRAAFYESLPAPPVVDERCDGDDDETWHSYRRALTPAEFAAALEESAGDGRRLETARMDSCHGKGADIAWVNKEVWDITGCCDTDNGFFFLLMVLFWYRPAITNLELIVWCLYWVVVGAYAWYKVKDIKDFNASLAAEAKAVEVKADYADDDEAQVARED